MSDFKTKVLEYFNLTEEDYRYLTRVVTVSDLPYPYAFHNFEIFIERIEQAITNNEQILVYGDYDADGILATAILKSAFLKRGVDVFTFIPSRYKEGYGLNENLIERFKARDIKLIITVDNGVSAFKAIELANKVGIDVLVSDHHQMHETLPDAFTFLHPHLTNAEKLDSAGAYMALLISYGLLTYYDDYLLSLAAIATIADMMPLVSHNRTLVRLGLEILNKKNYPQLFKLNEGQFYDAESLGLKVIPKINALGRLSKEREANVLIEYFTTEDTRRINEIAHYVISINNKRREISKAALDFEVDTSESAILEITDELEGMLGLISQQYVTKYAKPAITFTASTTEPDLLKGSGRSVKGFSLVEAFTALSHYLETFGGHHEAAGLSLKKDNYPAFKAAFIQLIDEHGVKEVSEQLIPLTFSELTYENFHFLNSLAPFGRKHKSPKFIVTEIPHDFLVRNVKNLHIIHEISRGTKFIKFYADEVTVEPVVGRFSLSEFNNFVTINFIF
ncbi:MAG TPA: DHH family phosphoesterase [Bacilli bacterium]|nr:DHH family phosphoesterase [Bacilli bacterium]